MLHVDLGIQAIYNGWYFVGRPSIEELRRNQRTIFESRSDYRNEAYDTQEFRQICMPQQEWANGTLALGANGSPVGRGLERWFDVNAGIAMIASEEGGDDLFFHFTTLPGQGYRMIRAGVPVQFEVVESRTDLAARNIQRMKDFRDSYMQL